MTNKRSLDIREVIFINRQAKDAYLSLPENVRQAADARTDAIQNHERLPRNQRESLSGELSGIDEIRISDDGNAYRVYYLVEFKAAIYMLDAGMKKSPRGGEIPKQQVETLVERKKKAREHYAKHKDELKKAMAERLPRRTTVASQTKAEHPLGASDEQRK
jgi:phage-related protein